MNNKPPFYIYGDTYLIENELASLSDCFIYGYKNQTTKNAETTRLIKIRTTAQKKDLNPESFYINEQGLSWVDIDLNQLSINFLSDKLLWRYQNLNKAQEPLLRAISWKANQSLTIWDLTAGLGRDSALLSASGCKVLMFERNLILQILLRYALLKAQHANLLPQLNLHCEDAFLALPQLTQHGLPDLAYMDPMYPERNKSSLVKQDLRIVKKLVGNDEDAAQLLQLALKYGIPKVIVKRPKGAEYLGNIQPHHNIQAPNTRFDVYMQ